MRAHSRPCVRGGIGDTTGTRGPLTPWLSVVTHIFFLLSSLQVASAHQTRPELGQDFKHGDASLTFDHPTMAFLRQQQKRMVSAKSLKS